ncbi:cell wall adhesin EAP1 isoform X1 [Oncorhynchus mykiss]|uniref:Uncharacterized protein n=1 Tax=Oncorhynchus mykiss TaxID=8022 RepID=A0A060Z650_ONCMY|nr:cell wall adhesin EAP1 isoform X1 [Oncorhynchus mykiss]CDQ97189.1 unnamed protein product [Oncorhynchus mykiss]
MAERVTWWRAFMGNNKRTSSGTKDIATQLPDTMKDPLTPSTQGVLATPHSAAAPKLPTDQQPPASQQLPASQQSPASQQPPASQQSQAPVSTGNSLFSDETFDDSQFESVFNEQTCRRNLRVSRSGRFKEKKRARSSLPTGKEDVR